MRTKLLLAFGALCAAIGIAVGVFRLAADGGSDAAPAPPVAEVYADVAAALLRPGMVAHVVFDAEGSDAWISGRHEAWVDVATDHAHERTVTMYRSPSVSTTRERGVIYRAGAAYTVGEDGRPFKSPIQSCLHGATRVLALLANCPSQGKISLRTESRRFDGVDALAVVIEGKLSGIDSVIEIHNRLFVDAGTRLPLAFESKGTDRYALGGYENEFHGITRYAIDFVRRDSLPPDFFDPSAIGYRETELPQAIDAAGAAFPIFWLGAEHPGSDAVPPIALSDVRVVGSGQPELGPTVELTYSRDDDEFAGLLTLSEMSAANAQFFAATGSAPDWRRDACATRTEFPVLGARAVLFEWHMHDLAVDAAHCPPSAPDGVALEVDFGDTFVTVLPSVARELAGLPNAYASAEALRGLAAALLRRN
jgi:hypothetical protein